MRNSCALVFIFLGCACVGNAQLGRTTDWWSYGGDAQRTGWEKNEQKFTKADVKDFRLLWKMKLDNRQTGPSSLQAPVIFGNLIGSRGFKELAMIAGSSNKLWVIDADLHRMYWQKDLAAPSEKPHGCSAGLTAMPSLSAPVVFRFPTPAPAAANTAAKPAPAPQPDMGLLKRLFSPKPIYLISSDGMLHRLNIDNGADLQPPLPFLPANAQARSLNVAENAIYTTTTAGCGGAPNAVWGIDLSATPPKVNSFVSGGVSNGADFVGLGGPVLGNDETVYAQTGDRLLALTPKELQLKSYFTFPEGGVHAATPVVFAYKGLDLIATAGPDGRLYLLDSSSLGGEDHKTPLYRTPPVSAGGEIWGGLSSWEDTDGTRYVLAAVWGPAQNGSIVAFKIQEQNGKPTLTPAWVSEDMKSPAPPVIAQGVVFALSNGEFTRKAKKSERPKSGTHATLYALDAITGKEMYSTGDQVTAPGSLTGLSIANGRLYFATTDNTMNVFGKYLETEP